MNKIQNLILFFLLFTSCSGPETSNQIKVAHKIISNVTNTLENRHNMQFSGLGEGGGAAGYDYIRLSFRKNGLLEKDKGRKIIVDCINELLNEINNSLEFRQYLINYPFTEENVDISIHIMSSDKFNVYYPDILFFSTSNGKIFYRTKSPEQEFGYKTNEHETFDEAIKIVESQKVIMDEKNTIEKLQ